jgi:hypothetical protein
VSPTDLFGGIQIGKDKSSLRVKVIATGGPTPLVLDAATTIEAVEPDHTVQGPGIIARPMKPDIPNTP